jgi:hypothetical protein
MVVDLLLYNGLILTVDEKNNFANWVAVSNGKVLDIGKDDGYKKYIKSTSEAIDLKGKTVLPGFYDSHVHLAQTGLNMLCVDLSNVKSIKELLELIKKKANEIPKGELIRAIGFDESKIKEKRFPTRYELDYCAPDNPVWINRVEYHTSIVNSMALHMLNLPFNLEGIVKNEKGLPNGQLRGKANSISRNKMLGIISDNMRSEGIDKALTIAIENGITTINAMEGGFLFYDKDAEYILENKSTLPIDVVLFYQIVDIEKVINKGLKRIGGCLFLDGSFGSRTAALDSPYNDLDGINGTLFFSQEELNDFVLRAHRNNLQITVHAIGSRAIEQILNAYEYAQNVFHRKDHRHRIEHFELPSQEHIERAARLNLILSMQPTYEYYWGGSGKMYETRLGTDRRKLTNPLKKIIDNGLIIAGGSDSDVTPMNPILGIYSAVNHPTNEYAIDVLDAIRLFTINGAKAVFEEEYKGSIEVGKYADFVILDKNPLRVNKEDIKNIRVVATIKEGNILSWIR